MSFRELTGICKKKKKSDTISLLYLYKGKINYVVLPSTTSGRPALMNRKEQFILGTLIAYMQMILSRTALRSLRQSL